MASDNRASLARLAGASSKSEIRANLLRTERREASVGWAVKTGRTEKSANQLFKSSNLIS